MTDYRLWPTTDGPATGESITFASTGATEFYVTQQAWATKLHFWRPTTAMVGPVTCAIFRVDSASSGTQVTDTGTYTLSGTGWQTFTLPSPLQLKADQRYRAAYHIEGSNTYPETLAYWSTGAGGDGVTNGILVATNVTDTTGGDQGSYVSSASITFPTESEPAANYWADVTVTDVNPSPVTHQASIVFGDASTTTAKPGGAVHDASVTFADASVTSLTPTGPPRWSSLDGVGPIGLGGEPSEWAVYIRRNDTLERVAELSDYSSSELIPRFNDVGAWVLTLDRRVGEAGKLTNPAYGIEVVRDGTAILSGPMSHIGHTRNDTGSVLTVSGPDDMVWLRRRLVHPEPGSTAPPYNTQAYSTDTAVCSALLRAYVNVNAAQQAIAPRQVAGLVAAFGPDVGDTITGRGRWQVLLELLQELALSGGGVGFRMRQSGTQIAFESYQPTDRAATVVFSEDLGNLQGFEYERGAPETTYVFIGGGGEGTARTIHEGQNSTQRVTWGRIETFVDRRDTTDATELAQAATEELAEKGETTGLSITPIDTEQQRFAEHYDLGDKVSVVIEGATVQELIREVKIRLTPDSSTVAPQVGTPGRTSILALFQNFSRLRRRVRNLERR